MSDQEIQEAIEHYLRARARLLELGERYPDRFGGNDNVIGRIGEFVALRFLEREGYSPRKAPGKSNPGYDLVEGERKIQVKAISPENQKGRSVRLTNPWDLFVLIELGDGYRPVRIGMLTREEHNQARNADTRLSVTPVVRLSMLSATGLIGKHGRVFDGDEVLV